MEHAEARELLEIAAVEPGGFARLVAGDTPDAAALAAHLAGCSACAAEMERLRRSAVVIRDAVRIIPPPELRERTLAYVAALGRPRGGLETDPAGLTAAPPAPEPVAAFAAKRPGLLGRAPRPGLWLASLAAAVIVAVAGTAFFVGAANDGQIAALTEEVGSLHDVAAWTIRIDRQADARHVAMAAAAGGPTGTLIFSPSSADVVVVASGLEPPPADMEYRCWVETGGSRHRIGQMFLGENLAYWVGPAPSTSGLGPGSTFGISLVPITGDSVGGDPVLTGRS